MEQKEFNDVDFGNFYCDGFDEWECKFEYKDFKLISIVAIPQDKDIRDVLNLARNRIRSIINDDYLLKDYTATVLLDTFNECWNEGELITAEDFINRISLFCICLYNDSRLSIHFKDNGLFGGHDITVSLSSDGSLIDAYI